MRVFFRFASPAGPMTIKAGIGLTASPSNVAEINVSDEVYWPDGCDYSDEVINEIASTVRGLDGQRLAITVTEIEFCEVGSSAEAFKRAAGIAVKSLFDVRDELRPA